MEAIASLQRPESDLDNASSSYVPSLASPTTRDSLDEGYDPDETLKVIVYDNEEIKIKSSGIYHDLSSEEEEQDDQDVVYVESGNTSNQEFATSDEVLRQSKDDAEDVVYISSCAESRTDVEIVDEDRDDNDDVEIVDTIQLHASYEDSQDVEIYSFVPKDATIEEVDAFDQLENGDIVEIGKFFTMFLAALSIFLHF